MDFGVSRCVLLTALIIFIQGEQTQLGAMEQSTEIDIQMYTELDVQDVPAAGLGKAVKSEISKIFMFTDKLID